jgi:hypothetical protein
LTKARLTRTETAVEGFKEEHSEVQISRKGHDSQENRVAAEKRKQRFGNTWQKEICTSTETRHDNPRAECRIWIEAYRVKRKPTASSFAWRTRLDSERATGEDLTRADSQGKGALAILRETVER